MIIKIDFNSEEAIYVQLRNQIVFGIATSQLHEGDSLPSVRQLADEIGINMHTVNKAYTVLKQEGLIDSDIYVETGPDLDRPILVRGYVLTQKALDTKAYEVAWEAERKACQECFKFDIGPCDKKVIDDEDGWIDL